MARVLSFGGSGIGALGCGGFGLRLIGRVVIGLLPARTGLTPGSVVALGFGGLGITCSLGFLGDKRLIGLGGGYGSLGLGDDAYDLFLAYGIGKNGVLRWLILIGGLLARLAGRLGRSLGGLAGSFLDGSGVRFVDGLASCLARTRARLGLGGIGGFCSFGVLLGGTTAAAGLGLLFRGACLGAFFLDGLFPCARALGLFGAFLFGGGLIGLACSHIIGGSGARILGALARGFARAGFRRGGSIGRLVAGFLGSGS